MSAGRRPTMRDVADEAGVSFKTVSRVVNSEPGVSRALAARVHDAVASLGYRPDHRARLLRQGDARAATIGFILVDVANPFFSSILRGIEDVASARECLVLAGSTDGAEDREHQLVEAFVGRRVDGLIVVPSASGHGPLESELGRGTPVVFLDIEPDLAAIDLVRSDHYAGAEVATGHLLAHGHHEIGYFGDDPTIFSAELRLRGFLDTMAEAGIDVPPQRIVTASQSEADWYETVLEHLTTQPLPTAVFSAQNYVTIGTVRALHTLGLQRSIGHVGFDDVELADVVEPGVTVMPQQPRELGRLAAETLLARIDGNNSAQRREILQSDLILRGSGEIPGPMRPDPTG